MSTTHPLKYLSAYPEPLRAQVSQLIGENKLGDIKLKCDTRTFKPQVGAPAVDDGQLPASGAQSSRSSIDRHALQCIAAAGRLASKGILVSIHAI